MGYTIDWGSAEVQEGQLSVRVRPDPDFAFLKVFDMVLIESPPPRAQPVGARCSSPATGSS
jgi:hypothetical protein